jgi:hypothetical protein
MKIKPSCYVLAAEILTITLFHVVKIRQAEKHPAEIVFSKAYKALPLPPPVAENKTGMEYALENMANKLLR